MAFRYYVEPSKRKVTTTSCQTDTFMRGEVQGTPCLALPGHCKALYVRILIPMWDVPVCIMQGLPQKCRKVGQLLLVQSAVERPVVIWATSAGCTDSLVSGQCIIVHPAHCCRAPLQDFIKLWQKHEDSTTKEKDVVIFDLKFPVSDRPSPYIIDTHCALHNLKVTSRMVRHRMHYTIPCILLVGM